MYLGYRYLGIYIIKLFFIFIVRWVNEFGVRWINGNCVGFMVVIFLIMKFVVLVEKFFIKVILIL